HRGATSLAHQFDVVDVGAAVGPVIGAWQRAVTGRLIEFESALFQPVIEPLIDRLQPGPGDGPVVQCSLQGNGDLWHDYGAGQIAGDHDQHAIAALVQ